jgi:L-lactate utilization protein LutC
MAGANTGSREQILQRVRAAVRNTAPKRTAAAAGALFPPVTNPLERFQAECATNTMECVLTAGPAGTAAALQQVLASLPAGEIFVQDAPQMRDLFAAPEVAGGRAVRWSSQGAPAESSQATISLCEALVALTGSVLVSSGCGGRGISVVAPCHIVVARRDQLVPDLEAALARARQIAFENSYVGLITGSSRTADIEKMLIIGAHGPRRLVVIVEGS